MYYVLDGDKNKPKPKKAKTGNSSKFSIEIQS